MPIEKFGPYTSVAPRSATSRRTAASSSCHPVVPSTRGTTGWHEEEAAVRRLVAERGATLVYGPNFSIGINLFYRVVAGAARQFRGLAAYDPFIEEAHHARKRDAPSGTAILLRDILRRGTGGGEGAVASTPGGHIPRTQRRGGDSGGDEVMLPHTT